MAVTRRSHTPAFQVAAHGQKVTDYGTGRICDQCHNKIMRYQKGTICARCEDTMLRNEDNKHRRLSVTKIKGTKF